RLRSGWIVLAALMGVSVAELPGDIQLAAVHGKGGDDVTLPDEDAAIRYGMEHRPDLAATRATLDRAQAAVGIVRSTFYPSVELAGSYGVSRPDNVDFEEDDLAGAIALVVRYDLFRGGERLAQISEANALRDKAAALLAQAQIEIVSEIRDAVSRLDATGEIFELQSRNVDLVERTRDLVELEYNAGGASLVRLNEAQRDLVEVRSRHATALASLRVAWHQLLQATAQPLEAVPDP
ncbi:MAG: TolC family protein, partial [Gemmatimonadetes bacterium]|nr:TolC family protein [Gemmatimonadota bacterium]